MKVPPPTIVMPETETDYMGVARMAEVIAVVLFTILIVVAILIVNR